MVHLKRRSDFAPRIAKQAEQAIGAYEERTGDRRIFGDAYKVCVWAGRRGIDQLAYRQLSEFVETMYGGVPLSPSRAYARIAILRELGIVAYDCGRGRVLRDVTVTFPALIEGAGGQWSYLRHMAEERAKAAERQRRHRARRGVAGQTIGQNASDELCQKSSSTFPIPTTINISANLSQIEKRVTPTNTPRGSLTLVPAGHPTPLDQPIKNFHSGLSWMKKSTDNQPPNPPAFDVDFESGSIFKDPTQTIPKADAEEKASGQRIGSHPGSVPLASSDSAGLSGSGLKKDAPKTAQSSSCGKFGPQKVGSILSDLMPNSSSRDGFRADAGAIATAPREMAPPLDFSPRSILEAVRAFGRTGEEMARRRLGETVWQAVEALSSGWEGVCSRSADEVGDLSLDVFQRVNRCARFRTNTQVDSPRVVPEVLPDAGDPWESGADAWNEIEDWLDAGMDERAMRHAAGPSKWRAMGQATGGGDCYGKWVSMKPENKCQKSHDAFGHYERQPRVEKAKPMAPAANSTPLSKGEAADMMARMMPGLRDIEKEIDRVYTPGTSIEDFAASLDVTKLAARAGRVSGTRHAVSFLAGVLRNKRAERVRAQRTLGCGGPKMAGVLSPVQIRQILMEEMQRQGFSIYVTPFVSLPLTQQIISETLPVALENLAAGKVKSGKSGFGAYLAAMMKRRCQDAGTLPN